jgi:hypothetical protein
MAKEMLPGRGVAMAFGVGWTGACMWYNTSVEQLVFSLLAFALSYMFLSFVYNGVCAVSLSRRLNVHY